MVGSTKKPAAMMFLLPSVLAVSLILSACQQEAETGENNASGTAETGEIMDSVASENLASNANPTMNTAGSSKSTPEKKLMTTLAHHRWTLVSATDANEHPMTEFANINSQVTLAFNQYQGQDTLSYSVGCNTISAAYQLQGHTLTTEEGMSTKMSCGDLDMAENTLNTLMLGSSELKVEQGESPILTQFTNDDVTLLWSGRLTSQAKYNSKAETIFWAVKSKKIACEANGEKQCLQVRPVTYNDQGIKIREGKWRLFTGEIDGYQHDGMHEEVLRLQRYQLDNDDLLATDESLADDNDAAYAYVLDAVIESAVTE
jgi:heat shock protein HslJ